MTLKILFYAINGVGLGHLSRQYAIARKLRELLKKQNLSADIRMLTTSEADYLVQDFPVYKLPSAAMLKTMETGRPHHEFKLEGCHFVYQLVSRFQPDILVLDTQPEGAFKEFAFVRDYAQMRVLIQRHVRSDHPEVKTYLEHLNLYDLLLIPDQESQESLYPLPLNFQGQRNFIGTVSLAEPGGLSAQELRDQFGFHKEWPIVYVSAGGGGDRESRAYLDQLLLNLSQRELYVLAGYGPLHQGTMIYRSNLIPLREPLIHRYFTGLDYAISAAGYNTYQELLGAGVPTLFYHQQRGLDQQSQRIQLGLEAGWHGILNGFEEQDLDGGLRFLKKNAAQLKQKLSQRTPADGALKGAQAILSHWQAHHNPTI